MAIITQRPAELDILAIAGTPFTLTVNVTATDSDDNPVPWDDFTDPSVVIQNATGGDGPAQSIPTVTSPEDNVISVVWSGAQTSILLNGTLHLGAADRRGRRWAVLVGCREPPDGQPDHAGSVDLCDC